MLLKDICRATTFVKHISCVDLVASSESSYIKESSERVKYSMQRLRGGGGGWREASTHPGRSALLPHLLPVLLAVQQTVGENG